MKNLNQLLIAVTVLHSCNSLFRGKFLTDVKNKAKDYYKSHFGKKGLNFLGYDLSEYPGAHSVHRDENIAKWDEYYRCLILQNDSLGVHRNFVPEAVLAYEGGYVKFDCKLCLSPESQSDIEAAEWDFGKPDDSFLTSIELTEHTLIAPEDKSLSMYNVQLEHTGQYVCRLGQTITAPIYLTVIKGDNLTEVHTKNAPKGPYPKRPQSVAGSTMLYVESVWSPWSKCSRCHKVGKRHKHGYCVIKNEPKTARKIRKGEQKTTISPSNSSTTESYEELMKTPFSTTPCFHCNKLEMDLLRIFEGGIPCNSHILPETFKHIPEVKNRTGEVMVGFCKIKCPKSELFEVRDKHGKVLEVANNSAGIYSMLQPLPPAVPPVVQQLQYATKGKGVAITCPGNLNTDTPITWQIAGKNVIPELLNKESGGRMFVTLSDKIQIGKAKISDSGSYSCWQNNELAGLVRLVVEKKIEMNFNHHIMLFGVLIILGTFLYVFSKAFIGRKYAKT